MTKQEFLGTLGEKLSEELSAAEVASQVRYYEGYLDGEIRRGRTEEEAVASIGDPILIARTIMESPREHTMFGTPVPDEADSYYEGAFQAENSTPDDYFEDDETVVCEEDESASDRPYEERRAEEPDRGIYGDRREESSARPYREPESERETEDAFRNMAGENVRGTVEKNGHGFLRDDSGSFSWGSFGIIVAAVMILVAVIGLLTRAVIAAGPVILVILAVILILNAIRKQ